MILGSKQCRPSNEVLLDGDPWKHCTTDSPSKEGPIPTDKTASNTNMGGPAAMSESSGTSNSARGGEIVKEFWQEWSAMGDRLYRRCLKLMNFNPTDAEEALSRAMLHAWEKSQNYVGKIRNLKSWLMRVTYNFCVDIIRKESRGAFGVEDIEWVGDTGDMGLGSKVESPEMVLEKEERSIQIRRAVDSLPEKMRDTFILHFYEELSHQEIVERQGISYDCVCKRISQARKKLKQMLRGYFNTSQAGGGKKIPMSPPKTEEGDLPKNRAPIVGRAPCNGTQHTGTFKNCKSQRPLRGSPDVLKGNEVATERGETEDDVNSGCKEKAEIVEGPVESRERVEVKIPDGENITAEADVDVAECSESVEHYGEEIVAGVCGENEQLPILPGVLSPLSLELTARRDELSFAPLSEWGREMLAAFLIGEVTVPDMSEGHKGAVGNWWRQWVGKLCSILDNVGVVIRKFFNVPDFSRSVPGFQVKGNLEGEGRRREMGSLLVEMVGAICSKIPRQGVGEISGREKAKVHLLKAGDFVDRGSFAADLDTG